MRGVTFEFEVAVLEADGVFPLRIDQHLRSWIWRTRELRARSADIGAGAEATLQATLATGTLRVTGYTVEIFYP